MLGVYANNSEYRTTINFCAEGKLSTFYRRITFTANLRCLLTPCVSVGCVQYTGMQVLFFNCLCPSKEEVDRYWSVCLCN